MGDAEDLVTLSRRLELLLGCPPLVRLNGKRPLDADWPVGPRTDPDTWRDRLSNHRANVGMVCGAGILALDFDRYRPAGAETLRTLEDLGWVPADTVRAHTGGGGLHVLLRYDPAVWEVGCGSFDGVRLSDGTTLPGGAEWRGSGGQIVVDPSVHASGRPYVWEDGCAPWETTLAWADSELLAAVGAVPAVLAAGSGYRRGGWSTYDPSELDRVSAEAVAVLTEHFGAHGPVLHHDRTVGVYASVTRPGKPADGSTSATVGYSRPGHVHVWSTNWERLPARAYSLGELRQIAGLDPSAGIDVPRAERWALVPLLKVRSRLQVWLWKERLPAHQFTLAAGQEKLGKSTALIWVAARLTRGQLPGDLEGTPANVVYVSAEDSADLVIKARAVAADADLARLYVLNPESPDVFELGDVVGVDPALVVFDPISAFIHIRGNNSHDEIAVRQGLMPFDALAAQHGIAVAGVRHVGKDRQRDSAYDAVLGSRAWTAAARAILFFTPDAEHKDRSGGLIFPRGNLAAAGTGSRYRLDVVKVALDDGNVGDTPLYVAEGETSISLEEALGPADDATAAGEAKRFLTAALADGPRKAAEVLQAADDEGIAGTTLRRAAKDLRVIIRREGFGKGSEVWWSLPTT